MSTSGGSGAPALITSATATETNVAQNAASVQLLAANALRRGASIFNDATLPLNVSFTAVASATVFKFQIAAAGYWSLGPDFPVFTGILNGIWTGAGAGAARITELTA